MMKDIIPLLIIFIFILSSFFTITFLTYKKEINFCHDKNYQFVYFHLNICYNTTDDGNIKKKDYSCLKNNYFNKKCYFKGEE